MMALVLIVLSALYGERAIASVQAGRPAWHALAFAAWSLSLFALSLADATTGVGQ